MSSHLNLASLRSGRRAADVAITTASNRSADSLSFGSRAPSRQTGALVADAIVEQRLLAANSAEATAEIALNQLRANDQVLIQTVHSTYIFLVTNPGKCLGLVVGGVFGDYAVEASLEAFPFAHDCNLRAGVRVRFYVESAAGSKRVTTSVITNLIHRKVGTQPQ
jgi:hypothetical protein